MQQIKVEKLPVDWFVSTTHYQSGNKEFIDEFTKQDATDNKTGLPTKVNFLNIPNHIFGTKHIQLIAANAKIWESKELNQPAFTSFDGNIKGIDRDNMDKIINIKEQGKDFFIYKVSEVVNGRK